MAHNTCVYHVVGVDQDGEHVVLVFKKPIAGDSFSRALKIDRETGAASWLANDEGVLPYREQTTEGEDLGLTWHFAK